MGVCVVLAATEIRTRRWPCAGWILCGVVFWLMALGFMLPLIWNARDWFRHDDQRAFNRSLVGLAFTGSAAASVAAPKTMSRNQTLVFLLATVVGAVVGVVAGIAIADAILS